MSNKTTFTPTGKVTTTVINKTSTPINVSRPHQGLQTNQPSTSTGNQTKATPPPPPASTQRQKQPANQTEGANSENPLSKVPVIGKSLAANNDNTRSYYCR